MFRCSCLRVALPCTEDSEPTNNNLKDYGYGGSPVSGALPESQNWLTNIKYRSVCLDCRCMIVSIVCAFAAFESAMHCYAD